MERIRHTNERSVPVGHNFHDPGGIDDARAEAGNRSSEGNRTDARRNLPRGPAVPNHAESISHEGAEPVHFFKPVGVWEAVSDEFKQQ